MNRSRGLKADEFPALLLDDASAGNAGERMSAYSGWRVHSLIVLVRKLLRVTITMQSSTWKPFRSSNVLNATVLPPLQANFSFEHEPVSCRK